MTDGRSGRPVDHPWRLLSGLLVWVTLLLAGCGDGAALDRLAQGPRGKVVEVRSGDRLKLENGGEVWLAGVEAPAGAALYAEESRRALDRLVRGLSVELLFPGARADAEGRITAHVRLVGGRRWVQGALLDAGAARVRTYGDDRALAAEMLAREARARAARRGLWALSAYGVRLPDEFDRGERGFKLVEGRVTKAGRWRGILYLDFARDWRSAISVRIPSGALRDFRSAGLDPLALEGRLIRVRGELSEQEGAPVIAVDHPEQIELLAPAGR